MTPLIELSGIRKRYGGGDRPEVEVLHGIDLCIFSGEFVAFVGASGSGKSTLMNLIGCLDRPSEGRYRFAGRDFADFDADRLAWLRREAFGFVFQGYHLIASETARENVEVPALYAGLPEDERRRRASALLERLGLGGRQDNLPNQLSGGQQQRVSIVRALVGAMAEDRQPPAVETGNESWRFKTSTARLQPGRTRNPKPKRDQPPETATLPIPA